VLVRKIIIIIILFAFYYTCFLIASKLSYDLALELELSLFFKYSITTPFNSKWRYLHCLKTTNLICVLKNFICSVIILCTTVSTVYDVMMVIDDLEYKMLQH
jgi:hypothetical protein